MIRKTTIQQQLVGLATVLQLSDNKEFAQLCMNASEKIDDLEERLTRMVTGALVTTIKSAANPKHAPLVKDGRLMRNIAQTPEIVGVNTLETNGKRHVDDTNVADIRECCGGENGIHAGGCGNQNPLVRVRPEALAKRNAELNMRQTLDEEGRIGVEFDVPRRKPTTLYRDDPHNPQQIMAGLDSGVVVLVDPIPVNRMPTKKELRKINRIAAGVRKAMAQKIKKAGELSNQTSP